MKYCVGKWHKKQFTNGDIVMFISAMKEINFGPLGEAKDCLYDIVTSQFNTSMEKKKLFRKAIRVHMQAIAEVNPRKSRRRNSKPASTEKSEYISLLLSVRC